jgi:hypothetical protein
LATGPEHLFKILFLNIFSNFRETCIFYFLRNTKIDCGDPGFIFFVERGVGTPPEEKQPGRVADQFILSSSEVKNA